MAVYWGAFIMYTYGTLATTPDNWITGFMLVFGAGGMSSLIGLWQLKERTWGRAQIWYALFFGLGLLGIFVSSAFPVTDVVWLLPIPVFVWFIYRQHPLYLPDAS